MEPARFKITLASQDVGGAVASVMNLSVTELSRWSESEIGIGVLKTH